MSYKQEYERWLHSDALSPAEHAELERIAGDEKEIENRFYGPLEFGTAGLRGTMKVGLHQMNIHVIRWATQGFANVIAAEGEDAKKKGVAICMDCRNNNMLFSHAAAEVCAANGIHVRIFESLRPTPELSFAVRYYGCQAGINVTASHNPKEYNGYKVYWSDGAQLPPQHADAIAAQLEKIDIFTGIKRIHVRIFESLRPTPELSFAVRYYGCQAGINVTASHNPKEYNGYKVYWSDGAQLPPQHADAIAAQLEKIDIFTGIKRMDFDEAVKAGLIEIMGEETDRAFMENVMAMVNDRESMAKVADTFKVVYTPFHGCGWKLVPEALRGLGVKHLYCVEQQMVLDGNFPTVDSPNPENPEGFYLAIELADKVGADFILGTDPDSDRVGIMVRDHAGKFIAVTGNQTGVLLLDYLIGALRRAGKMPEKPVFLKSIVTTNMARKVAESNGVACYDTFTGFKFMAEKKGELESAGQGEVIMSYEESYGYMLGNYVRDKDAVTASLLITEMAGWYAAQGMTLYDALLTLYTKYGWYGEKTHNLVMPGVDGLEKMAALMKRLRQTPPTEIAGVTVVVRKDYADGTAVDCATGAVTPMELHGSNVLRYELADGTTILVRPSGTEPKIKVYILTLGKDAAERDANLAKYSAWVETLTK